MDTFSSWQGAARRARRTPARSPARRRRDARAASWDGARRWWYLALGTLATALIMPRLLNAQGLRSQGAVISLQVIAPPELRAGASTVRRGPAVTDMSIPLAAPSWELARAEIRLERAARADVALYARDASGRFTPLDDRWVSLRVGAPVAFRVVASPGTLMPGGSWRVLYRLTPRDSTRAPIETGANVTFPTAR